MNVSDIWDWNFFWQMFRNFMLIPVSYWYQPTNDEYRISYREPSGISKYELHFTASSGMVYTAEYDFAPTGIHYLTCNGVYYLKFYDSSGKLVAKTKEVTTHRIEAPACRSYTEQESVGRDELNTNVDAENNISWDSPSGAETIEIWKEGEKVGEQDASDSTYENAGPKSVARPETFLRTINRRCYR